MLAFSIVYSVFGWKLFEFILNIFGLIKEEWWIKKSTLELKEYHPEVFSLRITFYCILFILLIPLLLKKSLDKLKPISLAFLIIICVLMIAIIIEASFFRQSFIKDPDHVYPELFIKKFKWSWIPSFFSIILSYYV